MSSMCPGEAGGRTRAMTAPCAVRADRAMRPSPVRRGPVCDTYTCSEPDTMMGIEPRLQRLGHHRLQRVHVDGARGEPGHVQYARRIAGHRAHHAIRGDETARLVPTPRRCARLRSTGRSPRCSGGSPRPAGRPRAHSPRPPRRAAPPRPVRGTARPRWAHAPPQLMSIIGQRAGDFFADPPLRESTPRCLFTSARQRGGAQRGVVVRQRVVPARGIEQVDVQLVVQPLPQTRAAAVVEAARPRASGSWSG